MRLRTLLTAIGLILLSLNAQADESWKYGKSEDVFEEGDLKLTGSL